MSCKGVTIRLTGEALPPPGGAGHIRPYSPSETPQAATENYHLPPIPCLPNQIQLVKSSWGSRPTCQWLQLDQGTARACGNHTEVAKGPLDTFHDVLSGWGLHWNNLWCQPPRVNKLHTHLGAAPKPSLVPPDRGQGPQYRPWSLTCFRGMKGQPPHIYTLDSS